MADQKKLASLLHAFAIGSADREDYFELVEHLRHGGDYNWQELGEYQNLAALLPAFLEIEQPDAKVKDKVARSLYRLRDKNRPERTTKISATSENRQAEQKAKVQTFVKKDVPKPAVIEPEKIELEPVQTSGGMHLNIPPVEEPKQKIVESINLDTDEPFETYEPARNDETSHIINIDDDSSLPQPTEPPHVSAGPGPSIAASGIQPALDKAGDQIVIQKKGISGLLFFFFLILIFAAIGGVYYTLDQKITDSQTQTISKLEEEVSKLKQQISTGQDIQILLSTKGTEVVALRGVQKYPAAFGKIIYNTEMKRGYLHLSGLEVFTEQKAYQLWFGDVKPDRSLGVFNFTLAQEYFPIANVPDIFSAGEYQLALTAEPLTGSQSPSKEIYLTGSIKN